MTYSATEHRKQLLEVSASAAERAASMSELADMEKIAVFTSTSKDAIAAAKMLDAEPAPVLAGLERLQKLLEKRGIQTAVVDDPEQGLADLAADIKAMTDGLVMAEAHAHANGLLMSFANDMRERWQEAMQRDPGGPASRMLGSLEGVIDAAEQAVAAAQQEIGEPDGEG